MHKIIEIRPAGGFAIRVVRKCSYENVSSPIAVDVLINSTTLVVLYP